MNAWMLADCLLCIVPKTKVAQRILNVVGLISHLDSRVGVVCCLCSSSFNSFSSSSILIGIEMSHETSVKQNTVGVDVARSTKSTGDS